MKKFVFLILLTLMFTTVSAENYLYYDDFKVNKNDLNFIDENGKAKLTYDTEQGTISVKTDSLCYPQFIAPSFTSDCSNLIIEVKHKFVYGGKSTVLMRFNSEKYTLATLTGNYEWTVATIHLDLDKHKSTCYINGKMVSETNFAEDKSTEWLKSAEKRVNIGHQLNAREVLYDYVAVYEYKDGFNAECVGFDDDKTLLLKTSSPVFFNNYMNENFRINSIPVKKIEADKDTPNLYRVYSAIPFTNKKVNSAVPLTNEIFFENYENISTENLDKTVYSTSGNPDLFVTGGKLRLTKGASSSDNYPSLYVNRIEVGTKPVVIEFKQKSYGMYNKSTFEIGKGKSTQRTQANWEDNIYVIYNPANGTFREYSGDFTVFADASGSPVNTSPISIRFGTQTIKNGERYHEWDYIAVYDYSDTLKAEAEKISADEIVFRTSVPIEPVGATALMGDIRAGIEKVENSYNTYRLIPEENLKPGVRYDVEITAQYLGSSDMTTAGFSIETGNVLEICNLSDFKGNIIPDSALTFDYQGDITVSEIVNSVVEGKLNTVASFENNTDEAKKCVLCVGFYEKGKNGEDILRKFKTFDIELEAGEIKEYRAEDMEIPVNTEFRCFVWNSINEMKIIK